MCSEDYRKTTFEGEQALQPSSAAKEEQKECTSVVDNYSTASSQCSDYGPSRGATERCDSVRRRQKPTPKLAPKDGRGISASITHGVARPTVEISGDEGNETGCEGRQSA